MIPKDIYMWSDPHDPPKRTTPKFDRWSWRRDFIPILVKEGAHYLIFSKEASLQDFDLKKIGIVENEIHVAFANSIYIKKN